VIAGAVFGFAVQSMVHPQQVSSRAAAAEGRAAYLRAGCDGCHGTVGQGGAGARLSPYTLPLEAFRVWVRDGSPGWSFARGMPGFSTDVLSDAELADVRAYLESLPPPKAVEDIPMLNL
jgi:mono/diheme cytochrome c family protein